MCISDHSPLYVTIDFHDLPKGLNTNISKNSRIKWDFGNTGKCREFFDKFKTNFDLHSVRDFCFCNKGSCNDILHWVDLESRWSDFVNTVIQTGYEVFGTVRRVHKVIPGWNGHIKELHRRARGAFKHWRRCGSPRNGDEATAMRRTRAAFKHAIRRCRQQEEAMRAEAMLEKLASRDPRAFWRGVAASGSSGAVRPDRIDGAVGDEDVARLWANKFGGVLNSVADEAMKREFFHTIGKAEDKELEPVTVAEIQSILKTLKSGKAIGLDGIPNDFYRYCDLNCTIFLSLMCNAFVIHEYLPQNVTEGKIMPLLKGKLLDITSSDNYRPITISASMSKVIERVLYNRIVQHLGCEDNQFGYRDKSSTDQCIFTLKTVIENYHRLGSPVYACYVDVKAAFDRVSYWKMFTKLLKRGVPKKIVNILQFWYTNQSLCVAWGDQLSHKFYMNNGIKQGALLSPYFFNAYVESLNQMLNDSRLGCCIANNPMNNLSWADDLVVIAPSSHALAGMMKVCDRFAEEHLMIFNTKKTKCMLFNNKNCNITEVPTIKLSGRTLQFVAEFTYLGHVISGDRSDDADILNQNRKLCARGNMLIRKFKSCSMDIKSVLFRTYCSSIYGMALWHRHRASSLNRLRVNFNNILRRLANRPPWSSASELFVSLGLKGFHEIRRTSCHSLSSRLHSSSNSLVQQLLHSDAYWTAPLRRRWNELLYVHPVE